MNGQDDPAHILVVDDDARLRALLQRFLTEQGFRVSTAENAAAARAALADMAFDLLVLDVMMPGETGLELTAALRAEGQEVPILMLTARGAPDDRIAGLEQGVDGIIRLTGGEASLLQALARRAGDILSREDIGEALGTPDAGERAIDVQVTRLRRKVEPDPREPRFIQTIRHRGYVLRPGP
jgi:two-component system phosphate regulon response regulator OmpR